MELLEEFGALGRDKCERRLRLIRAALVDKLCLVQIKLETAHVLGGGWIQCARRIYNEMQN